MDAAREQNIAGDTDHIHQQGGENTEPTSRICIKNLPKYVDENRLREHFSAKGEVTDAKIMKTRDGKSRCFGFIGFASAEEAEGAVQYFNRSFMDAMRLTVEFAYKYGGQSEAPRAWSKYTEGTSAHKRSQLGSATGANTIPLELNEKASKKRKTETKPEEEDPKLQEFLELMAPRGKKPIWANDDLGMAKGQQLPGNGAATTSGAGDLQAPRLDALDNASDDDDLYEELPTTSVMKFGNTSSKRKQHSSDGDDTDDSSEENEEDIDDDSKDQVIVDKGVSDMDYLRSRMRSNFDDIDGMNEDSDNEDSEEESDSSDSDDDDNNGIPSAQAIKAVKQTRREDGDGDIANMEEDDADVDADIEAIFHGDHPKQQQQQSGQNIPDEYDIDDQDVAPADQQQPPPSYNDNDNNNNTNRYRSRDGMADPEAVITQTGRLFVRNLPYTATEDDLRALFEPHGELEEVHVVQDRATRKSKGFAMIKYTEAEHALAAFKALDAAIFMGRLLHILPGKAPPPPADAENEENDDDAAVGAGSSFKRKQEAALKANAGDNKVAWNSLFMRADTVAEAVAAHFGVSKAELLDRDAPDMAVRLALGETQIIAQTKKALGDAGVNVSALESAAVAAGKGTTSIGGKAGSVKRSDTVLLVKNLPYSVDEVELESMFASIGDVARFVLPETHTLALVEFLDSQDARKAFRSLAYKRYQAVPLYMEWAPAGIFSGPPPPKSEAKKHPTPSQKQPKQKQKQVAEDVEVSDTKQQQANKPGKANAEALATPAVDDENVESSTIFVKNISFKTVDASLTKHFEKTALTAGGSLRSARVAKRKGADGKALSAGFGFVECSNESVARAVIKALQGSSLDGHNLVLQLAQGKSTTGVTATTGDGSKKGKKSGKQTSTAPQPKDLDKIVVRNVAFEATRQDILGLFTPFGHVKSCRLPRKFDGTPRGFAFVEFATPQEANNAVEAVHGTHLYGRRLVIEWAEEEGGLDELRAKTAAKFREDGEVDAADRPSFKNIRG